MKKVFKVVGVLFLLGVTASAIKAINGGSGSNANVDLGGQSSIAQAAPAIALPKDEAMFVRAIQKAQQAAQTADNDMKKGGIRAAREKELCSVLGGMNVSDWVGEVYSVSSNSDGKGVLAVRIAPGVYVQTWNNALSDVMHNTLIEPSSPVFATASNLKEGQRLKFSGTFFNEGEDSIGCLAEASLTLEGKLSEPEYIFRFSDVSSL